MSFKIFTLLAYTQTILSVVIGLLCFYRYRSRQVHIPLIGASFLLGAIANETVLLLGKYQIRGYYNFPSSIYVICNVCFLTAAYYYLLNKKNRATFILVGVLFVCLASLNWYFYQKTSINSYSSVMQAMIIIVFAILYFYKLLVELPERFIHKLPMFWINSAFLIFYSGTFILYTFTSYLTNVLKNDLLTYWGFHNFLSIVQQLLICVGLYYDLSRLKKKVLPDNG